MIMAPGIIIKINKCIKQMSKAISLVLPDMHGKCKYAEPSDQRKGHVFLSGRLKVKRGLQNLHGTCSGSNHVSWRVVSFEPPIGGVFRMSYSIEASSNHRIRLLKGEPPPRG